MSENVPTWVQEAQWKRDFDRGEEKLRAVHFRLAELNERTNAVAYNLIKSYMATHAALIEWQEDVMAAIAAENKEVAYNLADRQKDHLKPGTTIWWDCGDAMFNVELKEQSGTQAAAAQNHDSRIDQISPIMGLVPSGIPESVWTLNTSLYCLGNDL